MTAVSFPARSPAAAAPLPGCTLATRRPWDEGSLKRRAISALTGLAVIPMKAWSTLPVLISCATTARTVLIGMAKPIPMLPSEPELPVAIWAFTPITWPRELISGPPELPWLIGACV